MRIEIVAPVAALDETGEEVPGRVDPSATLRATVQEGAECPPLVVGEHGLPRSLHEPVVCRLAPPGEASRPEHLCDRSPTPLASRRDRDTP